MRRNIDNIIKLANKMKSLFYIIDANIRDDLRNLNISNSKPQLLYFVGFRITKNNNLST